MQLAEHLPLLPLLSYHAAVDGMSVLFMLLTCAAVAAGRALCTGTASCADSAAFLAMVFAVEASLQGMFVTQDLLWFTLLSAVRTHPDRLPAATLVERAAGRNGHKRYLQFMGIGLLLLVAGLFMLGWNYAVPTAASGVSTCTACTLIPVPSEIQSVIFFLLFYGLGIRIPLFPLHGWLPLVAEHGTVAVAGSFPAGSQGGHLRPGAFCVSAAARCGDALA